MITIEKPWTEQELMSLSGDGKHELVDGEIFSMPPAGGEHGGISLGLGARLWVFISDRNLGEAFDGQTGFWMKSGNLRVPDAAFVAHSRLKELGKVPAGFFPFAPDLAVEVISPSDRKADIQKRLNDYFSSETRLVWMVDPESESVNVHLGADDFTTLRGDDILSGEEILPGFTLRVGDIFAKKKYSRR